MAESLPQELYLLIFHYAAPPVHQHITNHYRPFDQSYKHITSIPEENLDRLRDHYHIAAVCKSWRSVALEILIKDLFIFTETQAESVLLLLDNIDLAAHVQTLWFQYVPCQNTRWMDLTLMPNIFSRISASITSLYMSHSPKGSIEHHPEFWRDLVLPSTSFPALKVIQWHIVRGRVESSCINSALDQVVCSAPSLEYLVLSPMVASRLFRMNDGVPNRPSVLFRSLKALAVANGMSLDSSMVQTADLPNLDTLVLDQRALFLHPTGPGSLSLLEVIGPQLRSLELAGMATLWSLGSLFTLCPNLKEISLRIDQITLFPTPQDAHRALERIRLHSHWPPYAEASDNERTLRSVKVSRQLEILSQLACPRLEVVVVTGFWMQYLPPTHPPTLRDNIPFVNDSGDPVIPIYP